MELKSSAFKNGGKIPAKYAERNKVSPPLYWRDVSTGTKSFALAMVDVDIPEAFKFPRVFAHWLVYNIPASQAGLVEGASLSTKLLWGAKELNNDRVIFKMPGHEGYTGPWPPDSVHRYVFTLYALKVPILDIPEGADYPEFAKAVLPQTILTATLLGYYGPAKEPLPVSG